MKYCLNCNRVYSDKYFRKHCRTNNHIKRTFEVKYICKKENILVNEIDNTLSDIIEEHKRKFHSFFQFYVTLITKKSWVILNAFY